jgi:hypothetical protein
VSLEGQHSSHLPTQVWESILVNKKEIEMLAESWHWGEKVIKRYFFLD